MRYRIEPLSSRAGAVVLAELLDRHDEFWGGRDLRGIHRWVWFHQFRAWGLLAVDEGRIVGYLLGVVTADGIGYVQAIAVLPEDRRLGVGAAMWREFARRAVE